MEPLRTLSLLAALPAARLGTPLTVPAEESTAAPSLREGCEPSSSQQLELADAPLAGEPLPVSRSDEPASVDAEPAHSAAADPTAQEGAKSPRSMRYWAIGGIAAGLSIVAIGAMLFGPWSKRVPAPLPAVANQASAGKEPGPAAGPSPGKPAVQQTPVSAPLHQPAPKALPVQTQTPAPTGEKSRASIQASDQSWVVTCVDNKPLFSKLFTAGTREDIEFISRAVVRLGRSSAVQILANGKPVETGSVGQVAIVELTPGDSRLLQDGAPGDCTHGL